MELRILGPVEVRDGARVLLGGEGKQVALLTLLALRKNEVVPSDRLVDELWEGRAPRTAAKTLQTYVSQLRRTLGEEAILTRAPGYLLNVPSGALDAERFTAQALAARRVFERGDPAEAAALLREALSLWRGPAFGGLHDQEWARVPARRLEEERLQAV